MLLSHPVQPSGFAGEEHSSKSTPICGVSMKDARRLFLTYLKPLVQGGDLWKPHRSNVRSAALPFFQRKNSKGRVCLCTWTNRVYHSPPPAPKCQKAVSVYLDVTRQRWLDSCLQPRLVFPPVAVLGVLMPQGAEVRAWGGWARVRRAGAEPQYSHLTE